MTWLLQENFEIVLQIELHVRAKEANRVKAQSPWAQPSILIVVDSGYQYARV